MAGLMTCPPPAMKPTAAPCPCGTPKDYDNCCGAHHAGRAAPTAEALMRSRYSAYALALEPYLQATWHASTRPPGPLTDAATRWLGLSIKRHEMTGADAAIVEFVARYKIAGRAHRLHEVSRFVRENGRWYYLDGEFSELGECGQSGKAAKHQAT
jgi:SEC-C motif-containing protein